MTYKEEFIKFMVDSGVLTFGDFTLKSGRKAPYFINCGNYKTGEQLAKLGGFYADCIADNKIPVETLFGPAYKGIPLAVSAVIALATKYGIDVSYCFDRKEAKDHGEGGTSCARNVRWKEACRRRKGNNHRRCYDIWQGSQRVNAKAQKCRRRIRNRHGDNS